MTQSKCGEIHLLRAPLQAHRGNSINCNGSLSMQTGEKWESPASYVAGNNWGLRFYKKIIFGVFELQVMKNSIYEV